MKKKSSFMVMLLLIFTLVCSSAAFAFQDLPEGSERTKIMKLKEDKIIQGVSDAKFSPNEELTVAQAIQMIVKGFDINIAHMTFIKAPLASDYYTKVPDDAWYTEAMLYAHLNGIDIPKDIDPNKNITREEYTHFLFQAMELKADLVFIELYIMMDDEADVTKEYMNSIQKMLIAKIVSLDEENRFHPKKALTRAEAAVMLHDSIEYVNKYGVDLGSDEDVYPVDEDVTMTIEKVNDEINKVTVDWGEQPNPGYSISIDRIEFNDENKAAVVYYSLHEPLPDRMYPQVIVYPKDVTYVASEYEVSIQRNLSAGVSHGFNPDAPVHDMPVESQELIQ